MAFLKKMLLPFVGLVGLCVVAVSAADVAGNIPEAGESEKEEVSQLLAEGESSLQALLGEEVGALDRMLKPMIEEMARNYGVSETELARVANEVMKKISKMDASTLQQTLSQLAGLSGQNMSDAAALQQLLGQLGSSSAQGEDI